MSDLPVKLILLLNRLVPPARMHVELARAKQTVHDYQQWEYAEIKRIFKDFGQLWDLAGRVVLDVGCGLGGKLLFYAEQGAKEVIGIDLRPFSIISASQLMVEQGYDVIHLAVADGAKLPFNDNVFERVISINVLEHVVDPLSVLLECRRVLRPEGRIYLYFPPFYSPWGAHLDGWINFPWPHLLFPERSLVRAAALIEEQKHINERFILSAQVHWGELKGLYELNRLTLRQFWKLIKEADLQVLQCRLLPFGHHALKRGVVASGLLSMLHTAARIPLLNEIIVTKVACVLTKTK